MALSVNCQHATPVTDAGLGVSLCAAGVPRPSFGTCAGCGLRVPRVDGPVLIDVCRSCWSTEHATARCQVPRDFDVEVERRRAKAGGCCHSAKG